MADDEGDFKRFKTLLETPCKNICRTNPTIVIVNGEDDPKLAFEKLIDARILSAPCKNKSGFCGFLDVRDLVSLICFVEEQKEVELKLQQNRKELMKGHSRSRSQYLEALLSRETATKMHPNPAARVSCTYLAKRNPFMPCSPEEPLSKVLSLLCQKNIRRVPIVSSEGTLIDIISQSSIIAYLASHVKEFKSILSTPLGERGISPVITVKASESAFETFTRINKFQISGLAVVSDDGALIASTSASDLKLYIKDPSVGSLTLTIREFLDAIRQHDLGSKDPVIALRASDPLHIAVERLAETKKHRLFVVDDKGKPIRVISLTDVIRGLPGVDLHPGRTSGGSRSNSNDESEPAPRDSAVRSLRRST